ncbi:hypothetical protein Mapa_001918 [Marchantia paleacea]|nr:hypothetical protein Mapa_001918 [Marchantia paleacea]
MGDSVTVQKRICANLMTIDIVRPLDESEAAQEHAQQKDHEPGEEDLPLEWEGELNQQAGLQKVENWQHFLANKIENETGMKVKWRQGLGDHQHMAKALGGAGKLTYVQYYIATNMSLVHGVFFFSEDMVSFPGVLHGGAQFTAFDETCGQLAFLILPGGCVTVHSDICFKKPFPAGKRKALVTARLEKVEGRKAIIVATLRDSPNGPEYSHIKMTYVKMPEKYRSLHSKLPKSNL